MEILRLSDVTFRRDGKQIIDGISLTVNAGGRRANVAAHSLRER